MEIIRITGNRGVGKTTVLRAYQCVGEWGGAFKDLTGYPAQRVKKELERIGLAKHLESRVTLLVDECSAEVAALLEAALFGNVVAVIAVDADDVKAAECSIAGMVEFEAVPDAEMVHLAATKLTNLAGRAGLVLTIERQPLKPLAMGHAEYVIETRPLRGGK